MTLDVVYIGHLYFSFIPVMNQLGAYWDFILLLDTRHMHVLTTCLNSLQIYFLQNSCSLGSELFQASWYVWFFCILKTSHFRGCDVGALVIYLLICIILTFTLTLNLGSLIVQDYVLYKFYWFLELHACLYPFFCNGDICFTVFLLFNINGLHGLWYLFYLPPMILISINIFRIGGIYLWVSAFIGLMFVLKNIIILLCMLKSLSVITICFLCLYYIITLIYGN